MTLASLEEQVTDGYHTIKELYDHLDALFASVCLVYRECSWKTKVDEVIAVGSVPEMLAALGVPNGQYIGWYLPSPIWERLDVQVLDSMPDTIWSSGVMHGVECLLGQPMPPLMGREYLTMGT